MDQSPALFHHWGGTHFPKFAFQWFKKVKAKYAKHGGDPFTRMEPRNLMVQFIAHMRNHEELRYDSYNRKSKDFDTDDELISYSIYLGKDSNDGDNSDNGQYSEEQILEIWELLKDYDDQLMPSSKKITQRKYGKKNKIS